MASMRPAVRSRSCCSVVLYSRISAMSFRYLSRKVAAIEEPCTPMILPFRQRLELIDGRSGACLVGCEREDLSLSGRLVERARLQHREGLAGRPVGLREGHDGLTLRRSPTCRP